MNNAGKVLALLMGLLLLGCGGGGSAGANSVRSSAGVSSALGSTSAASAASSALALPEGFALGADISWVSEMEANGRKFYNSAGEEKDAFRLMSELGINAIRLRVWVNPADGWYSGVQDVVAKAKRAAAQGQRLMIDFHYSDSWADPGKQFKPAAWVDYDLAQLKAALVAHTTSTLQALKDEGLSPTWVQVGNETNDGFLWDTARPSREPKVANMKTYAELTDAGYGAVKAIFPEALVIVHLANCQDNANFRWIFDGLSSNGARFDVIGASAYPTTATGLSWQLANSNCLGNLNDMVARYQRPVMLTEVGVPWDHAEGKTIVADLINKLAGISSGQGLGVFYWEPLAYNGWRGYSLGAFNQQGRPTAIMEAFSERQ